MGHYSRSNLIFLISALSAAYVTALKSTHSYTNNDSYYNDSMTSKYSKNYNDSVTDKVRLDNDERIPAHIREEIAQMNVYDDSIYSEHLKLRTVNGNVKFRDDAEGGFSKVMFRVMKKGDGKKIPVAIKMIRNAENLSDFEQYVDALDQAVNEWRVARMLREFDMYYAVNIYEAYKDEEGQSIYIVMDYLNGKDLWSYVFERHVKFTTDEVVANAARIGEMLLKLKWAGIIYRDLKFENMIMNRKRQVWMIDFGLAMVIRNEPDGYAHDFCGTVHTMSPEALSEEPQDYQSDVWSFGIVLYMLHTGTRFPHGPYGESSAASDDFNTFVSDVLYNMENQQIEWPSDVFGTKIGRLAKSLISRMLKIDPKKRLTMEEVLQDEWFTIQQYYFDHIFRANKNMHRTDLANPKILSGEQEKEIEKMRVEDAETDVKKDARHRGFSMRAWKNVTKARAGTDKRPNMPILIINTGGERRDSPEREYVPSKYRDSIRNGGKNKRERTRKSRMKSMFPEEVLVKDEHTGVAEVFVRKSAVKESSHRRSTPTQGTQRKTSARGKTPSPRTESTRKAPTPRTESTRHGESKRKGPSPRNESTRRNGGGRNVSAPRRHQTRRNTGDDYTARKIRPEDRHKSRTFN